MWSMGALRVVAGVCLVLLMAAKGGLMVMAYDMMHEYGARNVYPLHCAILCTMAVATAVDLALLLVVAVGWPPKRRWLLTAMKSFSIVVNVLLAIGASLVFGCFAVVVGAGNGPVMVLMLGLTLLPLGVVIVYGGVLGKLENRGSEGEFRRIPMKAVRKWP